MSDNRDNRDNRDDDDGGSFATGPGLLGLFVAGALCGAIAVFATGCANDDAAADADAKSGEGSDTSEAAATERDSAASYTAWTQIVRNAGGDVHPNGWATVLGIRGLSIDGAKHETESHQAFDDLVIVLEKSGKVHRLAASTHPWERNGVHGVPDVDRDGASDVGMIRPGLYIAKGRGSERQVGGLSAYDVMTKSPGTGSLPGWRDINHDGRFDGTERVRSESKNEMLTAVLFHRGGGTAPAAVGCQVFDEPQMRELITAVGGSSASFNYVLVDASSLDLSALPR